MGDIRNKIKNNLKHLIDNSSLSKKEIAEKLGASPSSVTNWINGSNSPDIETIGDICKLFDVSIVDLFENDFDEIKKTPSDGTSEERLSDEADLLNWIYTLTPEEVTRLYDLARLIVLPERDYQRISELIRLFLDENKNI